MWSQKFLLSYKSGRYLGHTGPISLGTTPLKSSIRILFLPESERIIILYWISNSRIRDLTFCFDNHFQTFWVGIYILQCCYWNRASMTSVPRTVHCNNWNSNSPYGGIRRWNVWKVIRVEPFWIRLVHL
jgi:hypothetical protein